MFFFRPSKCPSPSISSWISQLLPKCKGVTILLSLLSTQFSAGDGSEESDSPSPPSEDDVGDAVLDTAAAVVVDVVCGAVCADRRSFGE